MAPTELSPGAADLLHRGGFLLVELAFLLPVAGCCAFFAATLVPPLSLGARRVVFAVPGARGCISEYLLVTLVSSVVGLAYLFAVAYVGAAATLTASRLLDQAVCFGDYDEAAGRCAVLLVRQGQFLLVMAGLLAATALGAWMLLRGCAAIGSDRGREYQRKVFAHGEDPLELGDGADQRTNRRSVLMICALALVYCVYNAYSLQSLECSTDDG